MSLRLSSIISFCSFAKAIFRPRHLLLQGRLHDAALCLTLTARHCFPSPGDAANRATLETLAQLIVQLPVMGPTSAVRDVFNRHQNWHIKCVALLEAGRKQILDARVLKLLELLCGDEEKLAKSEATWQEMMIAHLLYVDPLLKRRHLRQLAVQYTDTRGLGRDKLPMYQRLLRALFDDELVEALKAAQDANAPWFAAHMIDLLFHQGLLRDSQGQEARRNALLAHIDCFATACDMWALGLQYLSMLGPEPEVRLLMNVLAARVCPSTEAAAVQLYVTCRSYGLDEAAASHARVWARRLFELHQYRDSLVWAERAQSHFPRFVAQLVNKLPLKDLVDDAACSAVSGRPLSAAPSLVSTSAVQFVDAYRGLSRAIANGDMPSAAACLMELVGERCCPKKFWIPVLEQCIPLFEDSMRLFTADQLRTLMARLEWLLVEDASLSVDVLSLLLTRCLARALVCV